MQTMSGASEAKVSHRGQTTLPADLRHRWGISDGGQIGIIDLGDSALILPGGLEAAKAELHRAVRATYEDALASIDDENIADQ